MFEGSKASFFWHLVFDIVCLYCKYDQCSVLFIHSVISVTIVYWVHRLNCPECIVSFGSSCLKKYCTCLNIYCMYHSERKKEKKRCDVIISLRKSRKRFFLSDPVSLRVLAEQKSVHWFGLVWGQRYYFLAERLYYASFEAGKGVTFMCVAVLFFFCF